VVQGCYTLIVDDKTIPAAAGGEYIIPKGQWYSGEPAAGTRTMHAFGGPRRAGGVLRVNRADSTGIAANRR